MSDARRPTVDAETLAALLDGTLVGKERDLALEALEQSPELLGIYADAAAVRSLAEEPSARSGGVVAFQPRRWKRFLTPALLAAALLIAALAIEQKRRSPNDPDVRAVIATLADGRAATADLPPNAWDSLRGAADDVTPQGRSARLGARIADVELLASANDPAASGAALRVAAVLENIPGGNLSATAYKRLAAASPAGGSANDRDAALRAVEQIMIRRELRAGAWLEVSRLAAQRRDTSFFSDGVAARSAQGLAAIARPADRAAADSLAAAIGQRPLDFTMIEELSTRVLRSLGR